MHCPGCGSQFKGTKGVLIHLKRTTDKKCKKAYKKILNVDSDSESSFESSDSSDSDEDPYPGAENQAEVPPEIDVPMDFEPAGPENNSDFFGPLGDPELEGPEEEIQFDLAMDDVDLGLNDIPDLEEDSDIEDADMYIW